MVPAYLEHLPIIPMTVATGRSQEAACAQGPAVLGRRAKFVSPRGETETIRGAGLLAEVLKLERVSAEDNFLQGPWGAFAADGALSAPRSAALRACRTSRFGISTSTDRRQARRPSGQGGRSGRRGPGRDPAEQPFRIPSNLEYYGCVRVQAAVPIWPQARSGLWVISQAAILDPTPRSTTGRALLRSLALTVGFFVAMTAIRSRQVAVDRQVEGGGDPRSGACATSAFWVVKNAGAEAPVGGARRHPIYQSLSAAAGPRSGRRHRHPWAGSSRFAPTCSQIGDNTIIRKDSILLAYKAQSNYIHHRLDHDRQQRRRGRGEPCSTSTP